MKNFEEVTFRKGSAGLLSTTGAKGWWYPSLDHPVIIQRNVKAKHLTLWKNQDPYFAFRVPAWALNKDGEKDICVWFHEKSIIIEKGLMSNFFKE